MNLKFLLPIFLLPLVIVFGEKLSKQEFDVEVDTINKILESTYRKHEVRVQRN